MSQLYHRKIEDVKTDQEEQKHWHRLAAVLNLLVSIVFVVTQVVILIVNLYPCLIDRKDWQKR